MKQNKTDKAFNKELDRALMSGDIATVSKFLDEGVSVHYQSDGVMPPMAYAINKGNLELARLLIQRGLEINRPLDDFGRTAVMHAFLKSSPIYELLVSAGADLTIPDKYGYTMMHMAAGRGDLNWLKRFEELGLRLDLLDQFGDTPFIEAIRNGKVQCAEFLMQKGADVNQRGRNKKTALIVAGQKGLLEVCQWLLSKGAELHAKDDFNKTALDWARTNGHTKVVEFLEQQMGPKS